MLTKRLKAALLASVFLICTSSEMAFANNPIEQLRLLASAQIKLAFNDRVGALKEIDKAIQAYPQNAEAFVLRATLRGQDGNFKGALEDCNVALYLKPGSKNALRMRAASKAELEDYKGAIDDLTLIIQKNDREVRPYLERAEAYIDLENEAKSLEDIKKAQALDPSNSDVKFELLRWHIHFRKYKEAIPLAENFVKTSPKSADAYGIRAQLYSRMGQTQKAIDDVTKAIQLEPKNDVFYTNRGFEKIDLKDYKGSLADSEVAIKLNSKTAYPVQNSGLVYFLQRDFVKAASFYKKSADLYTEQDRKIRAHMLAAFIYKLAGMQKESIAESIITRKLSEKNKLALIQAYMEGTAKEDKVLAVSQSQKYQVIAKTMMALELLRLKKAKEAQVYFNWIVQIGNKDEDEFYIARTFLELKSLP